jgi:hypothetical protein
LKAQGLFIPISGSSSVRLGGSNPADHQKKSIYYLL